MGWPGKVPIEELRETLLNPVPKSGPRLAIRPEIEDEAVHQCPQGMLYKGDNLQVLQRLLATHRNKVALIYLDPPFLTGRAHMAVVKGETLDDRTELAAFDDRWDDLPAFLDYLRDRLIVARELLAPHGSLVLHVDPKTSHALKLVCDEVFGEDAFASEIVWRYRRWPTKTPNFQRMHDVLLRYRKDPKVAPRWNQTYEPLAASTITTWGVKKQKAVFAESGRRARSSSTEEATSGAPMSDVWEIGVLAPVAKERTGYPTQKPEALLERIVEALSDPGDWVLDPFTGSGTTIAVAKKKMRKYIGIDASPIAIQTAQTRLERIANRA